MMVFVGRVVATGSVVGGDIAADGRGAGLVRPLKPVIGGDRQTNRELPVERANAGAAYAGRRRRAAARPGSAAP